MKSKSELLEEFGEKCLKDLLQGEREPDWQWQEEMIEEAVKVGLVRIRPVEDGDDAANETDFVYEIT